jgi:two-component system, cell cycle sensor histidine kinase and response regulator CckA
LSDTHFICVHEDVTERRQVEEGVSEEAERLRRAIDAAALATWHWDIVSGRETWSERWYEMFGLPSGTVGTRETFLAMVHPDDRELLKATRANALTGSPFDIEYRIRSRDGTERWIASKGRAYFDAGGKPLRMEGVARDVTEYKRLGAQLRQAQKMEAVGRLAGGIAHDFNNLMAVILGYTEVLIARTDATPAQRAKLAHILKASERAASLTRQLLAFSRKQVLEPKLLDLNAVVRDFVQMIGRLIGEDIVVDVEPDSDLGKVHADPGQVEQVILNIALNARDAMPAGGRLTFETANVNVDEAAARAHPDARPGAYVRLTVRDTGGGMDAATLSKIFEPFFTTKGPEKGTGLGLATVYGIVAQSGGHVAVESALGRGTTFHVYLPRVPPSGSSPVEIAARPAPSADPHPVTILVVDDDAALRALAEEMLAGNGYGVVVAASGEEALVVVERHGGMVDVLMTELVMPGMGGPALAERLLIRHPRMKVLFMSGYSDGTISHDGVLDPGVILLSKPFSEKALLQKVREALDRE